MQRKFQCTGIAKGTSREKFRCIESEMRVKKGGHNNCDSSANKILLQMLTEEFQFFHAFLASSMSNNDPAWITTKGFQSS